jgi:hypothetical protein
VTSVLLVDIAGESKSTINSKDKTQLSKTLFFCLLHMQNALFEVFFKKEVVVTCSLNKRKILATQFRKILLYWTGSLSFFFFFSRSLCLSSLHFGLVVFFVSLHFTTLLFVLAGSFVFLFLTPFFQKKRVRQEEKVCCLSGRFSLLKLVLFAERKPFGTSFWELCLWSP